MIMMIMFCFVLLVMIVRMARPQWVVFALAQPVVPPPLQGDGWGGSEAAMESKLPHYTVVGFHPSCRGMVWDGSEAAMMSKLPHYTVVGFHPSCRGMVGVKVKLL